MPISVADLLVDRATLTAWCSTCQTYHDFRYDHELKRFPSGLLVLDLQARMRCRKCGGPGEVWARFHSDEILAHRIALPFTFNNRPFRRR